MFPSMPRTTNTLCHLHGETETQVSVAGEVDLHKHLHDCEKNPGHTDFIPVDTFTLQDLPTEVRDELMVDFIKAMADLTVRIGVDVVSPHRPLFWPGTTDPYPFTDEQWSKDLRSGSGRVFSLCRYTEEDGMSSRGRCTTCPCHSCVSSSSTPSRVWWVVQMMTSAHVVFDQIEARHAKCRLFFDGDQCPLVVLDGHYVGESDVDEDRCVMECVTCDVSLITKLDDMIKNLDALWLLVYDKYVSVRDAVKLMVIVSHPHGCSKQVSIGHWTDMLNAGPYSNFYKFLYKTGTCPGSSGAPVFILGYSWWGNSWTNQHVHSGVLLPEKIKNCSGIGGILVGYQARY